MSFRPTEYTVRQLLIEELRRRGVKVTPEISFVSPVGRLVADLLLQNGGSYVVDEYNLEIFQKSFNQFFGYVKLLI